MDTFDNVSSSVNTNVSSGPTPHGLVSLVPDWVVMCALVFICLASLIGIPGNSLVLGVLVRNQPKTSTDWFIIFIAICDIISLSVNVPIDIFRYQPDMWIRIGTPALCKVHYYLINVLFINSNFLILVVGVDRFLKTCRPHSSYFTPKLAFRFCVVMTVGSLLFAVPNIITTTASISGTCLFDREYIKLRVTFTMTLMAVTLTSSLVLVLMYSRIAMVLKRRAFADMIRRETTQRALRKSGRARNEIGNIHGIAEVAIGDQQGESSILSGNDSTTEETKLGGTRNSGNQTITRLTGASISSRKSGNQTSIIYTGSRKTWDQTSTKNTGDSQCTRNNGNQTAIRCTGSSPDISSSGDESRPAGGETQSTPDGLLVRVHVRPKTRKIHPEIVVPDISQPHINGQLQDNQCHDGELPQTDGMKEETGHSKRAKKTTKIIFFITLLYIIATVIPSVMATFMTLTTLRNYAGGQTLIFLTMRLYTINHFTNPLLYMCMSLTFRRKMVLILKSCGKV